MKIPFLAILNWIKGNKLLSLFILLFGVASALLIIKAKATAADCTPYQEQVRILSQTLEQVSKAVDALSQTSSHIQEGDFNYAVYIDTTKRPLTQSQQQVILKNLRKKIDSAKWKVDSINRSQQKQIPQTKT